MDLGEGSAQSHERGRIQGRSGRCTARAAEINDRFLTRIVDQIAFSLFERSLRRLQPLFQKGARVGRRIKPSLQFGANIGFCKFRCDPSRFAWIDVPEFDRDHPASLNNTNIKSVHQCIGSLLDANLGRGRLVRVSGIGGEV